MRTRFAVLAAVLAILFAGCDEGDVDPTPAETSSATAPGSPSADPLAPLLEAWRPRPAALDDQNLLDSIAYVCTNPADPDLKAAMEGVPIALVDARGDSLVSVILADEHVAFECRVRIELVGGAMGATIIGAPARLAPDSTGSIGDADVAVVSHTRVDEETGSRTILIGRVGPKAFRVVASFDDESEVEASKGNGWFYAWWPGTVGLGGIASVDSKSLVQSSVSSPATQIEGRVGPAAWWVDPGRPQPGPDTTTIAALARERLCAGGRTLEGRQIDPTVFSSEDAILVTVWVRQVPGPQACPDNPAFPLEITLPEPLGERRLLDGSEIPPRDAAEPPS